MAGAQDRGQVTLESSDARLAEVFRWARDQALAYVFDGDPVGPWYEAALPGREAFCIRDVCHQSIGAQVLGLAAHTKNMLLRFAESISASRDWCGFWEITRDGGPAPVDYASDADFWYNLPANFDLVHACYRQYLWTGDRAYIEHRAFLQLYARTANDYIQRWDRDGDGIPEHRAEYGRRGIASYNEEEAHPMVGGDLLGAQYGALRAYAEVLALRGATEEAGDMLRRAAACQRVYNRDWWNEAGGVFYGYRRQDGSFASKYGHECHFLPLYFGIVDEGAHTAAAVRHLVGHPPDSVERSTYVADILIEYGRADVACALLRETCRADHPRSAYPEVSFCAVGALTKGLCGLAPEAHHRRLRTVSRLRGDDERMTVGGLPVMGNVISVSHEGAVRSRVTNERGADIRWVAGFNGDHDRLAVDGRVVRDVGRAVQHGQALTFVEVEVPPAGSRTVEVPR